MKNLPIIEEILRNMIKTSFTLVEKKQLTHDVYELRYNCPELQKDMPKSGQYVMFQLAPGLNRAYSIASFETEGFVLIIKRIPDGRGSPLICDAEIGASFSGMLPLGHFFLQDTTKTKCFLGTGTGFAPLYAMILELSLKGLSTESHFAFGIRSSQDLFYMNELSSIAGRCLNFNFSIHMSREKQEGMRYGYVTDILEDNTFIQKFEEYYLCGSPAMVKSAREKLETQGIKKENIYFEQY